MKNKLKNGLQYAGTVTLSQYVNGKKILMHTICNSGTNALFRFFADCLLGDFTIASSYRPTKVMLLNQKEKDGVAGYDYTSASGFVYMLKQPVKTENSDSVAVTFSFNIPREYLESQTFNCIGLYADNETNPQNVSAYFNYDTSKLTLSASSVLVVDWKLEIFNYQQ